MTRLNTIRKRPPKYISLSNSLPRELPKPIDNSQKFSTVQIGCDDVVYVHHNARTPAPMHTRPSTAVVRFSNKSLKQYDQNKNMSWKYYGEIDNQMGCLTEHIQIKEKKPRIYARSSQFHSRFTSSLFLPSSPRSIYSED